MSLENGSLLLEAACFKLRHDSGVMCACRLGQAARVRLHASHEAPACAYTKIVRLHENMSAFLNDSKHSFT